MLEMKNVRNEKRQKRKVAETESVIETEVSKTEGVRNGKSQKLSLGFSLFQFFTLYPKKSDTFYF